MDESGRHSHGTKRTWVLIGIVSGIILGAYVIYQWKDAQHSTLKRELKAHPDPLSSHSEKSHSGSESPKLTDDLSLPPDQALTKAPVADYLLKLESTSQYHDNLGMMVSTSGYHNHEILNALPKLANDRTVFEKMIRDRRPAVMVFVRRFLLEQLRNANSEAQHTVIEMLKTLIAEDNTALATNAQIIIAHYKDSTNSDVIKSAHIDEDREESKYYETIQNNRKKQQEPTSKKVTGEF